MGRLIFSLPAQEDLFQIWVYVAARDRDAADRLAEHILKVSRLAATLPGLGRTRDDLRGEMRSIPVISYVLFYEIVPDGIRVARILHGSRDIPPLLS